MMEQHVPDVVLMDIYFPDISGLEVMRHAAHLAIDYVTITAARDVDTLHYLVKPFTFSMLQEKLGQIRSWRADLANTTINGQAEVDRLVSALRAESVQRQGRVRARSQYGSAGRPLHLYSPEQRGIEPLHSARSGRPPP